jgi:hypothetical protein
MANEQRKFKIVDDSSVRESYANKLISASFDGGAVVVTLGATRFVPEDSAETGKEGKTPPVHVTARVAISPSGAVELANALNNMLKTLAEIQKKTAAAKTAEKTN